MQNTNRTRRREPMSDTQLLLTITICIFFGLYILAMAVWGGGFLRAQQVFDMLNNNAALIIVACSLTIVMICGGIDISVGGVISLVVMACVVFLESTGNLFVTILLALGIGLAFGLVQGFLVAKLEIQPFIVTLAGMFFARGMTTIISINPQKVTHEGFQALMNARIEFPWLGYVARNGNLIPARMELGVVVALLIVVLVFIMLRKSRLGRNFYAIGGNSQSALMLGINVQRTRFIAHLLSSVLAGIAGFVFMMHTGAGNASNAQGMEMDAIASAIIGGTLLSGGVGNIFGTLFGVMTLATIRPSSPPRASTTRGGRASPPARCCFFILLQARRALHARQAPSDRQRAADLPSQQSKPPSDRLAFRVGLSLACSWRFLFDPGSRWRQGRGRTSRAGSVAFCRFTGRKAWTWFRASDL